MVSIVIYSTVWKKWQTKDTLMSVGVLRYNFIYQNSRQATSGSRAKFLDFKTTIPKVPPSSVPHAGRPDRNFCVISSFLSLSFSFSLSLSISFFLENIIIFSFKNVFWVKCTITQQLLHNLQCGTLARPRQLCFAAFFCSQLCSCLWSQTLVYLMSRQWKLKAS